MLSNKQITYLVGYVISFNVTIDSIEAEVQLPGTQT